MRQQIKKFLQLFEGIYTPGICGLALAKESLWGLVFAVEHSAHAINGYYI